MRQKLPLCSEGAFLPLFYALSMEIVFAGPTVVDVTACCLAVVLLGRCWFIRHIQMTVEKGVVVPVLKPGVWMVDVVEMVHRDPFVRHGYITPD